MAKLQGRDAAFVAAALVQAEATVLGGMAAGSHAKPNPNATGEFVRIAYEGYLEYVLGYDPDTGDGRHELSEPTHPA
jgi:hypothetical protein